MKGILLALEQSDLWVGDWIAAHYSRLAFSPEQVIAAAVALPEWPEWPNGMDGPGIYFLQRAGKVCYVGLGKPVGLRLNKHFRDRRPFDAVTVLYGIHPEALSDVEAAYILAWDPPWNQSWPSPWSVQGKELQTALAAMPKDLVCTEPELGRFTEAELLAIAKTLDE